MILVTLTVAAPPDQHDELLAVFWLLLGPLRAEPGCVACKLYQEIGNEQEILYVEEWETREDLERHMRSPRYDRLLALMEASSQPPILRYCFVSATAGLEYLEAVRLGGARSASPGGLLDREATDTGWLR